MGRKITVGLCGDFWTDEVIKMTPKAIDMIIWPVFVDFAVELWEKSEFIEYVEKAKSLSRNVFFVNSICKEEKSLSHGGAFALIDNTLKYKLNMDEEGILYCTY
jgi:hypothetical protein